MDKDDYVSLKVAKKLKEKGFSIKCSHYWGQNEDQAILDNVWLAPTLYEVQKWLREKHKLFISSFISNPFIEPCTFIWTLQNLKEGPEDYTVTVSVCSYYSFEKALEEGISEALKLI